MRSPLRERTAGALDGIAGLELETLEPGAVVVVLSAVGDALRLDMPLGPALPGELQRRLSEAQILRAVDALAESVDRWSLPEAFSPEASDSGLEWALRRRDEVVSVLTAARRVLLPRGILVDGSANAERLARAVAAHDLSCGGTLTRAEAERLLGERGELAIGGSWLEYVAWAPEEAEEGPDRAWLDAAAGDTPPSLELLEGYVVFGRLRKFIESAAARWPEVADELADMIATYREHAGRVGFIARLWDARRRPQTSESGGVVVSFERPGPAKKLAASDGDSAPEAPSIEHELGILDPLDAQASLTASDRELVLTVYAGATALREVTLGSAHAEPPVRGGVWSVRLPWDAATGDGALRVRVRDAAGRDFDAQIALGPDPA